MKQAQDLSKSGTLISCSLSCFIVALDYAIVNTAIPAIEKDIIRPSEYHGVKYFLTCL